MLSSFHSSVESRKQENLCSQGRTSPLWCHSFSRLWWWTVVDAYFCTVFCLGVWGCNLVNKRVHTMQWELDSFVKKMLLFRRWFVLCSMDIFVWEIYAWLMN